jgi:hypothetical protein
MKTRYASFLFALFFASIAAAQQVTIYVAKTIS